MITTKVQHVPNGYIEYAPQIGDYKKDLFKCYVDTSRLCAIFYKGKSSKPVFHNRFRNEDDMKKKINNSISALMTWEDRKNERKQERKQPHTLKIGDILYTSWGYDQTNVDFYQVTKIVGNNSVQIREISGRIERSEGHSDYVVAVKDAFRGEPEIKRVSSGNYIRISSYASASLWDGRPKYQTALGFGH